MTDAYVPRVHVGFGPDDVDVFARPVDKDRQTIKKYVLGFAFTKDRRWVTLIEKTKPEGQRGKLNGVGGKIEAGESPLDAMRREFIEETGFAIDAWRHYATMRFANAHIYCFEATFEPPNDWCPSVSSMSMLLAWNAGEKGAKTLPWVKQNWPTEEVVCIASTENLPKNVMTNLRWLIPMACDVGFVQSLDVIYNEVNDK